MESTPKPGPDGTERPFPIVGIGASAGGLDPLVRFLSALPDEFGFALVFIQHLSPTHKSLLPSCSPPGSPPFPSRKHPTASKSCQEGSTSAPLRKRSASKRASYAWSPGLASIRISPLMNSLSPWPTMPPNGPSPSSFPAPGQMAPAACTR